MQLLFLLFCFVCISAFTEDPPSYDVSSVSAYRQDIVGVYCRTEKTTSYRRKEWSSYQKHASSMYLYLTHGYWRFSKNMGSRDLKITKWFKVNNVEKYPHDIHWKNIKIRAVWDENDANYRTSCWKSSPSKPDQTFKTAISTFSTKTTKTSTRTTTTALTITTTATSSTRDFKTSSTEIKEMTDIATKIEDNQMSIHKARHIVVNRGDGSSLALYIGGSIAIFILFITFIFIFKFS